MGGDHAPQEIVLGATHAAPLIKNRIVLVGKPSAIETFLPKPCPHNIEIIPASEEVGMDEKPTEAYRSKKDSSLMIGVRLVQEGRGEALISAGNTGAATTFATLTWRQLKGIHRPAIACNIPNKYNGFLLIDGGASPDVDPEHLVEFAIMGRAYAEKVMGRRNPKVHLLNIGEEEGKGNALAKKAYSLLKPYKWFEGNIEGKDMFMEPCDVVVCDAFVGNIVLKTGEGLAELIMQTMKDAVPKNFFLQLPYAPLRGLIGPLKKRMDFEEYGGSPLLGLNGNFVICHGRSSSRAIKNAILLAQQMIEGRLLESIRETMVHRRVASINEASEA